MGRGHTGSVAKLPKEERIRVNFHGPIKVLRNLSIGLGVVKKI